MNETNPVVWSEGLFLRPQHFQQHERHVAALVEQRSAHLRPYGYGLTALELDETALALGKVAIRRASGVLPDGTPFSCPDRDPPPPPFDVPRDAAGLELRLCLPLRRAGVADFASLFGDGEDAHLVRYDVGEVCLRSAVAGGVDDEVPLEVGRMRLGVAPATQDLGAFTTLGIARVAEVRADGRVQLDDDYVPTCLDANASARLVAYLREVEHLLGQRGDALSVRVAESGRGGAADIAEFLRLQAVNRFQPLCAHLASVGALHPEDAWRVLVQLAGELATFTRSERRPAALPTYRHDALDTCFQPLMHELRRALTLVDQPTAISLPLEERGFGLRVAPLADASLLGDARFVLAVSAELSADKLRSRVPRQLKVGPRELIRDLVNSNLPGIELSLLPVMPRQIPYHAGALYFELDRGSRYFDDVKLPGGFALHVSGEFPGLELELWAVRSDRARAAA